MLAGRFRRPGMWLSGRYLAVQAAVRRRRRWRNTERAPVLLRVHGDFDEAAFHHTTFREFLRRISEVDTLDELDLWPAVRAFNSILTTACVMDELEVGVACMGIIERAFAGVSATIGRVVVERGWITRERLVHYALHGGVSAAVRAALLGGAWQRENLLRIGSSRRRESSPESPPRGWPDPAETARALV